MCKRCRSRDAAIARYGTSHDIIEAIRTAQDQCCAICGVHETGIEHQSFVHSPLVIDHCHETGKVRGLLCPTCNVLLGHAKDSIETLKKAVTYLRKYR